MKTSHVLSLQGQFMGLVSDLVKTKEQNKYITVN